MRLGYEPSGLAVLEQLHVELNSVSVVDMFHTLKLSICALTSTCQATPTHAVHVRDDVNTYCYQRAP